MAFALNGEPPMVAGAGVVENAFHERKDLTPNLYALYVDEACRGGESPAVCRTSSAAIGTRRAFPGSIW